MIMIDTAAFREKIAKRRELLDACDDDPNPRVVHHSEIITLLDAYDALDQVSGALCPACGWAGIRADEPCAFCQQEQYIRRIAELESGLQLAQATCAVYSEKVDMLESQLAAQESAHDPQP
jgi:hypothetical protein